MTSHNKHPSCLNIGKIRSCVGKCKYRRTGASQGPALVRKSYWSVLPSGHSNLNYCRCIKRSVVFSRGHEDSRRSLMNYDFVTVMSIILYITPKFCVYLNYKMQNSIKLNRNVLLDDVIYCTY